jgi:DNA-binding transcriptional regulator YhcF (GntR family)
MAAYFLKQEEERKEIADELRTFVHETYNPGINAELLMSLLKKHCRDNS